MGSLAMPTGLGVKPRQGWEGGGWAWIGQGQGCYGVFWGMPPQHVCWVQPCFNEQVKALEGVMVR